MSKIKHELTDEIVCPYCGHTFSDSYEHTDNNDTATECEDCGEWFWLNVNISVDYTTEKLENMKTYKQGYEVGFNNTDEQQPPYVDRDLWIFGKEAGVKARTFQEKENGK